MRFLLTADWHIHPWRECSRDGGQDRLQDGLSAARQLLQAARDRECPLVVPGDLKHLKDRWVLSALNGLLALFEEYADVPKVLLHGNHDGVAGGRSGLEAFRAVRGVSVVTEPTVAGILGEFVSDKQRSLVAWWPHQPTLDGLPALLEQARRAKTRVLFAHAFLAGAALGPNEVRLPGVGVTLEQFGLAGKTRVFDAGFFGDIHKRQFWLGGWKDSVAFSGQVLAASARLKGGAFVAYAGGSYAQNWGERETDKGALYVDLDAGTIETVPVKAPRFRVIDLTDGAWSNAFLERWLAGGVKGTAEEPGVGMRLDQLAGDFVRLIVGSWAKAEVLERVREASGARAFQVIVQRESRVEQRADVHGGLPQAELLKRYVAARPPGDGLEPAKVLAAGQRLLEEK